MQRLGDGMNHGGAHAAADAEGMAAGDEMGGAAQRAGDVGNGGAGRQTRQLARAVPDGLDDQRNGSGAPAGIGDGKGDALGISRLMDDDELPGAPNLGDPRGGDVEPENVAAQLLPGQYFMHG